MEVARQKSYAKPCREEYTKCKPCAETPAISTLEDLIRELYVVFESETANVEHVEQLMTTYKSNPADWRKYAKFDRCR
jgi:cysteine dioxygenase